MKVEFRRRRKGKTDYKARLLLLQSGLPRLIIRKTNKHIIAQIVKSKEAQDTIVYATYSKELSKYGWSFSFKNLPSSYLTGFLLGIKAKEKIKKAILDIGLQRSTKGSRLYAALKGVLDSGIEIKHKSEMLPSEDRIKGKHINEKIAEQFEKVKEKILRGANVKETKQETKPAIKQTGNTKKNKLTNDKQK